MGVGSSFDGRLIFKIKINKKACVCVFACSVSCLHIRDVYSLLCRVWSHDQSLWLPLVNLMCTGCVEGFSIQAECGVVKLMELNE